jgi:hypothetical protein
MKVSLYTTKNPRPESVEVKTFTDLRNLVGGDIEVVATQSGSSTVLANEDGIPMGLPRNAHYTGLVGDVVVAPDGWQDLPYGD